MAVELPKEPCILPWVEIHFDSYGHYKNCCAQDVAVVEKAPLQSLEDLFNGPSYRALRESFLAGKTPDHCLTCERATQAGSSYRLAKAPHWDHLAAELLSQDPKKNLRVRYLDVRFSNVCNFACRTCDSFNSSRWRAIETAIGVSPVTRSDAKLELSQIVESLDGLEEIYFAGGEPLLHREHYLLVEEIIRRGLKHIKLSYNTNLSVLGAFGFDAVALWKRHGNVALHPSLDSVGKRGEYIRHGLDWEIFQANLRRCREFVHSINSVLSAYNVFSIGDLALWVERQGLPLNIFPAYAPAAISAATLPKKLRFAAAASLRNFAEAEVVRKSTGAELLKSAAFLEGSPGDSDGSLFYSWNSRVDAVHGIDFLDSFPEHREWFKLALLSVDDRGQILR